MSKVRMALFNAMHGETIAHIEMDEELFREEAGIVDPETLTLRPLKKGGQYTLLPMKDHTVEVLKRLKSVHERVTQDGCPLCTTWFNRMDEILQTVGLLFNKIEYVVVETADDMQALIDPPNAEYQPRTVEYDVLGGLLADAEASESEELTVMAADV